MPSNYEYSFELKPGKRVYIQTQDASGRAKKIVKALLRLYFPSSIFHHFRRGGGHVRALKRHLGNQYFSTFDIDDFFGRVTRTRIARVLKALGLSDRRAFDWAFQSVVVDGSKKILPFGFVQSPLLATLVLEHSALGVVLKALRDDGLTVTVYMDDIVISGPDRNLILAASDRILAAAEEAGFPLSEEKVAVAVDQATAFNIHFREGHLEFTQDRLARFARDFPYLTADGQASVERYAAAVASKELPRLQDAVLALEREEIKRGTEFGRTFGST